MRGDDNVAGGMGDSKGTTSSSEGACDIMEWLEEPKGMRGGLEYHFYYSELIRSVLFGFYISCTLFIHKYVLVILPVVSKNQSF